MSRLVRVSDDIYSALEIMQPDGWSMPKTIDAMLRPVINAISRVVTENEDSQEEFPVRVKKITEEINDCIAACKADLANDGVNRIDEKDGLIIRAVTLYCKAEFGYNNNAEKFRNSYDTLKMRLSMSQEYNTPIVSKTDTVGGESGG